MKRDNLNKNELIDLKFRTEIALNIPMNPMS